MAVTVRALKAFVYHGATVQRGAHVTFTNPAEAAARARKGEVSLDRAYNARTLEAETPSAPPEPEQPQRRRGRPRKSEGSPSRSYRRRDMVAEE